jgi:antitoxin HicB
MRLQYPVILTPDEKFLMVTSRDVPEFISQGDSVEDALWMASDGLECALSFYFEMGKRIPMPSPQREGERMATLRRSISNRALRWNTTGRIGKQRSKLRG